MNSLINMLKDKEKREKNIFYLIILTAGLLIFVFNVLTPMMTDDLFYKKTVLEASSLWELILQEYSQYQTWTGRSVCHMILRIFLTMDKMVFNIANSIVFVLLTLFIYWNVEHKKRYDAPVYILINLLIWIFGVVFRQTVLWETGACNYLWGSAIIMGFLTLYRHGVKSAQDAAQAAVEKGISMGMQDAAQASGDADAAGNVRLSAKPKRKAWRSAQSFRGAVAAVGMFLLGVLAGWCNENTSGGGILMAVLCLAFYLYEEKQAVSRTCQGGNTEKTVELSHKISALRSEKKRRSLRLWMVTGLIGQFTGFLFMALAPGNALRAATKEEEHSGLFAYVSRFQKINLAIQDNFLILLIIFLIVAIIVRYQNENWRKFWEISRNGCLWAFIFLATCYALVLTPEPMPRAYFGAGIFLIVAVVQFFVDISEKEKIFAMMKTGMISVMLLLMFFTYLDSGANVARVYREYQERDAYLAQKASEGVTDVTVPMLRPDFENKYSDGYNSDIQEDPGYWVNVAYASYYGFDSVSGTPREGWEEY